jgi:hypothetical protein
MANGGSGDRMMDNPIKEVGSFCRDTFAGVTDLPPGMRDNPLMAMMLSVGMLVARRTCVSNEVEFRVSINSASSIGGSAASSPSSVGQTKSAGSQAHGSTFESLMDDSTPYDEVKVNLPNGMSVGIVHFGGGGFDSSALKSIEDFVQRLASQQTEGNPASTSDQAQKDTPDAVGIDMVHVDLPNGISFEVRHSSGGQATNSAAVMKELTDAAEELAESLTHYAPASAAASAYASQQATSSGRNSQVDARS